MLNSCFVPLYTVCSLIPRPFQLFNVAREKLGMDLGQGYTVCPWLFIPGLDTLFFYAFSMPGVKGAVKGGIANIRNKGIQYSFHNFAPKGINIWYY